MENKNIYSIGKISEILNISSATIRYWEKKGLIKLGKNIENNYREFNIYDLIDLSDLKFFRSIDIPVKKLIDFKNISLEEITELIDQASKNNNEKLQRYKKIETKLKKKKKNIEEIKKLKKKKYYFEEIDIDKIVEFEYSEKEKTALYTEDTNLYIKFQNSKNINEEIRGIAVKKSYKDKNVLWEKKYGQKFITFLVKEFVNLNYTNDIETSIKEIQKKYKTGLILSKFLVTAVEENELIDYFKAYVEILE